MSTTSNTTGIDPNAVGTFFLDLSIRSMREYIQRNINTEYDSNLCLHKIETTLKDLSGLLDACGDMTGFCPSILVQS